jgi:hypothetical protein
MTEPSPASSSVAEDKEDREKTRNIEENKIGAKEEWG